MPIDRVRKTQSQTAVEDGNLGDVDLVDHVLNTGCRFDNSYGRIAIWIITNLSCDGDNSVVNCDGQTAEDDAMSNTVVAKLACQRLL